MSEQYQVLYTTRDGRETLTGPEPREAAEATAKRLDGQGYTVASVMDTDSARSYMQGGYNPAYRGVNIPRRALENWERGVDAEPDGAETRNVYLDTEFLRGDLSPSGLVSIALTDDQGRDYYAVNAEMDYGSVMADDWMRANVWPFLPKTATHALDREHKDCRKLRQIRNDLTDYFQITDGPVHLYAYYGTQDVVRLHSLWDGNWDDMPGAIPRWFFDLKALAVQAGDPELPRQASGAHHPLEDARHNRTVHHFLTGGES